MYTIINLTVLGLAKLEQHVWFRQYRRSLMDMIRDENAADELEATHSHFVSYC